MRAKPITELVAMVSSGMAPAIAMASTDTRHCTIIPVAISATNNMIAVAMTVLLNAGSKIDR